MLISRAVFIALFTTISLRLQSKAVPSPAAEGLDLLVRGYPDSAIAVWTPTWVAPEDRAKKQQLLSSFQQLPVVVGQPLGYDLIRVIEVTPHLRRVYVPLRCQRQPAYFLLVLYQARDRWMVSTINWSTDADRVLPATLLGEEHPVKP